LFKVLVIYLAELVSVWSSSAYASVRHCFPWEPNANLNFSRNYHQIAARTGILMHEFVGIIALVTTENILQFKSISVVAVERMEMLKFSNRFKKVVGILS
jgi:hypothetical protein